MHEDHPPEISGSGKEIFRSSKWKGSIDSMEDSCTLKQIAWPECGSVAAGLHSIFICHKITDDYQTPETKPKAVS